MTLQRRLLFAYAAILFAALLLLAAAAVFFIDRTLRTTLDARLRTEGFAAASLVDTKDGNVALDADDRGQFLTLAGAGDQSAVADRDGRIVFASVSLVPNAVARLARRNGGIYDAGSGEAFVRAFVVPIVRYGVRAGTVLLWHSGDYIEQADRGTSVAFVLAGLAIALLTIPAGALVTSRALDDAFARQRRFTADASHELRAPLAVILAEADLALRRERGTQEYRAALTTIASEAHRMEAIAQDLLSAARAEGAPTQTQTIDVAELTRGAAARLSPAAAAKRSTICVNGTDAVWAEADPRAIERALTAVLHNAVKFAPGESTIDVSVASRATTAEVIVRDAGPGFSQAALRHGFERFWRGDARHGSGSGLGLAIAKALVEASGGTIQLANAPEGGGVVVIQLRKAVHSA